MRPRVSAIVITRGNAFFLRASIASALAQPETGEVVVAHDRRPGEPPLPADLLADPRVRVVPTTAPGTAGSRNAGTRAARFPWLAFLDDDDAWLPGHLAAACDALDRVPGAAVVGTNAAFFFDPEGTALLPDASALSNAPDARERRDAPALRPWRPGGERRVTFRDLLLANPILASAVVVAGDRTGAPPLFDESLDTLEDYDLWVRLRARHELVVVPPVTALIRKRQGSMSRRLRSMALCGLEVLDRGLALAPANDTLSPAERRRRRAGLEVDLAYACLAEGDGPAARTAALGALRDGRSAKAVSYLVASLAPGLARRWCLRARC